MSHVVTANRLHDGRVVFRAGGGWSRDLTLAGRYSASEAAELVARIAAEERHRVVGPYAAEIGTDGLPTRLRERLRSQGPSVGER